MRIESSSEAGCVFAEALGDATPVPPGVGADVCVAANVPGGEGGSPRCGLLSSVSRVSCDAGSAFDDVYAWGLDDQCAGSCTAGFHDSMIGRGAWSTVHRVVHRATGNLFAAKVIRLGDRCDMSAAAAEEEVRIHSACAARVGTVAQVYGAFREARRFIIVMELAAGGDFFTALKRVSGTRGTGLPEAGARHAVRQLLQTVAALHAMNVVHRDIKPENILINSADAEAEGKLEGVVAHSIKLTDFGNAVRTSAACLSAHCGSSNYIAPEIVGLKEGLTRRYGHKVDLWSVGVVMYVLLFLQYPFAGGDAKKSCSRRILAGSYLVPASACVSAEAQQLLGGLLQPDPATRLSAKEALRHPWFAGLSEDTADSTCAAVPDINTALCAS